MHLDKPLEDYRSGKTYRLAIGLALLLSTAWAQATSESVLETVQLTDRVYGLIGPTTNRDQMNLGNNANFGVIVTDEGVVLIDPGANSQGAAMIHDAVRSISEQPIKWVINTGGQDHRWLGNGYFKALGARIIAHEKAVEDQKARFEQQWARLEGLMGAAPLEGTEPVHADDTFVDQKTMTVGGIRIEIHHRGHAHTPGDSFVWLPEQEIVFSGDIVYVDRMLGVGAQSAHRSWIGAFEAIAELQPKIVVAGHGRPSSLQKASADTYDYLVFLREAVQTLIDDGYGMEEIGKIDQSTFSYLENFDALKGRNAQRVYEELEWE